MNKLLSTIALASIALLLLLTSCMSLKPPSNTAELCDIFAEKSYWYRQALDAERKWQIDLPVLMAVIKQESSYVHNARPPRNKLLWLIPWKRPSSAYGYSQALDETWSDYQHRTGNKRASRTNFRDSINFVGWYFDTAARHLGLARNDVKNLYIAYHEGLGGYESGAWRRKQPLMVIGTRVEQQAIQYQNQLFRCDRKPASRYR